MKRFWETGNWFIFWYTFAPFTPILEKCQFLTKKIYSTFDYLDFSIHLCLYNL